ncbi:MAG: hypothetical protein JNL90_03000 [Planctomycetes bacterium]|nr:hypothetical protein [Planctomycetota bacterium]
MSDRNFVGRSALALLASSALALPASAQEQILFSLSAGGTAPFGALADTEVARFDPLSGRCLPWLSSASGAFFAGDLDGDGDSDEWKDVDALHVEQAGGRITALYVSFNATTGPWLDGDVVRIGSDGLLEIAWTEAELIAAFGFIDGQVDVDAFHVAPDGRLLLSFAEDEASTLLSTDATGVVTDGSVVTWDPLLALPGVETTEGAIDALVSNALGKSVKTGDTLSVALDAGGALCFTVQSPTSDDATLFRAANGGEVVVSEPAFQLTGSPEIDALALVDAATEFLATRVTPRSIPANVSATVTLDGAPNHAFVVTLSLTRGDAASFTGRGFAGLFLDPTDLLFAASLADFTFTWGATDGAGSATLQFDPAPPGIALTVFAQAYDFDGATFGAPLALELEG